MLRRLKKKIVPATDVEVCASSSLPEGKRLVLDLPLFQPEWNAKAVFQPEPQPEWDVPGQAAASTTDC